MAGYKIKEIYFTLQGEGAHSGRPAVFCRFTGCNLWSGREADRHEAICQFCDTDFWGTDGLNGGRYQTASDLAKTIEGLWPDSSRPVFVVCTGGEPLLQLDEALIDALHSVGAQIAVETNGTITPPKHIDWICVSPKAKTDVVLQKGDELKLVFPQKDIDPIDFENWDFDHFYLQPMDGPDLTENTQRTIDYCRQNPRWKLSLQTHKLIGIP